MKYSCSLEINPKISFFISSSSLLDKCLLQVSHQISHRSMVVHHIRAHQVDQVVPLQEHHLEDPLQAQAVIITTGLPHLVQSLLRQISKVSKN